MNLHILIIEKDIELAQLLEQALSDRHYRVTRANSGIDGLIAARELEPDLIVLDLQLPGLSGLELCRRLRLSGSRVSQIPLILISAKPDISDCVAGLDAGADDYVLKPFNLEELLARVRSRLRQLQLKTPHRLEFEDLILNRQTREVYRRDRRIELTVREFDLLDYLMSHPQQVMTREQILDRIWDHRSKIDSNILEVYIRYLRLKLEANHEQRLIHTVRGVGYVLRIHSRKLSQNSLGLMLHQEIA
jgi:DNA-binding response OmpR family regulator